MTASPNAPSSELFLRDDFVLFGDGGEAAFPESTRPIPASPSRRLLLCHTAFADAHHESPERGPSSAPSTVIVLPRLRAGHITHAQMAELDRNSSALAASGAEASSADGIQITRFTGSHLNETPALPAVPGDDVARGAAVAGAPCAVRKSEHKRLLLNVHLHQATVGP